jgi:hypothetical protein
VSEAHRSTQKAAAFGRAAVTKELRRRGFHSLDEKKVGRIVLLLATAPSGRKLRLRVKSRRAGQWQASTSEGRRRDASSKADFWVFVDLTTKPHDFFVLPEAEIRRDIRTLHDHYLEVHGGECPETPGSLHHKIAKERIQHRQGAWPLLE